MSKTLTNIETLEVLDEDFLEEELIEHEEFLLMCREVKTLLTDDHYNVKEMIDEYHL